MDRELEKALKEIKKLKKTQLKMQKQLDDVTQNQHELIKFLSEGKSLRRIKHPHEHIINETVEFKYIVK